MARRINDGKGRLGGRQKGTPNKATTSLRQWLQTVLDENREKFLQDLSVLTPAQRVNTIVKLLDFSLPKLQAIQASVDFDHLTNDQINAIIDKLAEDVSDEDSTDTDR